MPEEGAVTLQEMGLLLLCNLSMFWFLYQTHDRKIKRKKLNFTWSDRWFFTCSFKFKLNLLQNNWWNKCSEECEEWQDLLLEVLYSLAKATFEQNYSYQSDMNFSTTPETSQPLRLLGNPWTQKPQNSSEAPIKVRWEGFRSPLKLMNHSQLFTVLQVLLDSFLVRLSL